MSQRLRAVVVALAAASAASAAHAELRSLLLLHTNDFHGHLRAEADYAGAARIAAYFADRRLQRDDVFVVDAGDAVSGTPVSTLFKGLPIFEVMSAMGYDAGILGNHEFDYGHAQIARFRERATFPLLSANAHAPDGRLLGDAPLLIATVNGIDIGVIGVVTEHTPQMIIPEGNENLVFEPVRDVLLTRVAEIAPKVDVVIVVSHVGHEEEIALAREVPGIDVIVGGHSHTRVDEPVRVGDTWVVQAHEYGRHVGWLELEVDTKADRVVDATGGLVAAGDLPQPDAKVAALVDAWEQRVAARVDVRIAEAPREVAGAELKSWMEGVLRDAADADAGYYNTGGVRDRIRPGPVTARMIWNIEPFGNSLVTLRLSGADMKRVLARSQDTIGIELDDARTYLIATNNFIGQHAVRALGERVVMRDLGVLIRDLLIEDIAEHGVPDR